MRQLVTGEQMKAVDQYAIQEVGIPSLVLSGRRFPWWKRWSRSFSGRIRF